MWNNQVLLQDILDQLLNIAIKHGHMNNKVNHRRRLLRGFRRAKVSQQRFLLLKAIHVSHVDKLGKLNWWVKERFNWLLDYWLWDLFSRHIQLANFDGDVLSREVYSFAFFEFLRSVFKNEVNVE